MHTRPLIATSDENAAAMGHQEAVDTSRCTAITRLAELPENMAAKERQKGPEGPRNSNISRTRRSTASRLTS